jgi:hypothetical protein
MNALDTLNTHIQELKEVASTASSSDPVFEKAQVLAQAIVGLLGAQSENGRARLLTLPRVQSEITRFVNAPGFARKAGAYDLTFPEGIPLDVKLFWLKKTTKANLAWVMGLTPNWEDNPTSYANRNIGIDFVLPESGDRLLVVLSSNFRLRVMELHDHLTHTQREIFTKWLRVRELSRDDAEQYKKHLHSTIWESFDYEPTNREFYKVLVEHFDILVAHLTKQGFTANDAKLFGVRLFGRLLFLWFLRKKEFLNPAVEYFSVTSADDQTQYYRTKLEPLFFTVLNAEIKDRAEDTVTPYLNGGLFEDIAVDHYKDARLTFPPSFFASLYTKLDHYNFTADEGTSEYEQVAIDPEMLGRVFENLLASLHDETGSQARKAKGAFYTPREIVDYMCTESLIEYLKTKLPETPTRDRHLRELVTMSESTFRDQDHNKRRDFENAFGKKAALDALEEVRVLDPAVGSGAFPIGMLHLLVKVFVRLNPALERNLAKLKREILSRSLYGADIDQMAIQIARLRAWLSILVDMEELKKVDPLPNLDFKFVCANTLLPLAKTDGLFDYTSKGELVDLRNQYYNATRKRDKDRLRKQYREKIYVAASNIFGSTREKQLAEYDPFDPLTSTSFYDSELMHGVPKFDVVIGNPPYVQLQKNGGVLAKMYEQVKYTSFARTGDIYALFYERGLELTKKDTGLLCYITSNKWMRAGYGEKLRGYFASKDPVLLIDFGGFKVFESATVDTNILLVRNGDFSGILHTCHMKNDFVRGTAIAEYVREHGSAMRQLTHTPWFIGSDAERSLKAKIESVGVPLKEWDVKINYGIKTGLNEAFIIDSVTKEKLIAEDPKSAEIIKPILRGRDIKRYGYDWQQLYLLFIPWHFPLHNDTGITGASKQAEDVFCDHYPAIYRHLLQFKDKLNARNKTEVGKRYEWYALQRCAATYYSEFEKEKIVWPRLTRVHKGVNDGFPRFCCVEENVFVVDSLCFITGKEIKYILGFINSSFAHKFYKDVVPVLDNGGYQMHQQYVEKILIPKRSDNNKNIYEEIVNLLDQILVRKKESVKNDTKDLEKQIDYLVYQLYNLTPEEIALIEKS